MPSGTLAHPAGGLRPQPFGGRYRSGAVGLREDHAELLAAQSNGHIAVVGQLAQQLAEACQDAIADLVAVAIVDPLEVIEVADQQGDVRMLGDQLGEMAAVAQAGQRIVRGQMLEQIPRTVSATVRKTSGTGSPDALWVNPSSASNGVISSGDPDASPATDSSPLQRGTLHRIIH
jgi:hypothetical protein